MKITAKNLWILLSIIGILLISGCIGEKPEEEQPEPATEPAIDVNETEPGIEPAIDVNETEPGKTENYSDWCEETAAKTIFGGRGGTVWVEGIVEFKGKQMCHSRYSMESSDGITWYDWYFTKNEEEVYRVITYPNGTKEETKFEKSIEDEEGKTPPTTFVKTIKDPSGMVLELNDLPSGYNIIEEKTGAITEEEHIYSPEELSEMEWEGGYKIAFENENLYLFSLDIDYKQYLKEGVVDEQVIDAFKDNKISISSSTTISKMDDKNWRTYDTNQIKRGKIDFYIIEETDKELKIYKKSPSNFLNYRQILNNNSVYRLGKIKEVFNDAKQTISASAVKMYSVDIGDECVLYKKGLTVDDKSYTVYILIFRKSKVYEEIQIMGLTSFIEEREVIDLAKIVEKKIK